jgi:hypothetical protein
MGMTLDELLNRNVEDVVHKGNKAYITVDCTFYDVSDYWERNMVKPVPIEWQHITALVILGMCVIAGGLYGFTLWKVFIAVFGIAGMYCSMYSLNWIIEHEGDQGEEE